MKVGKRRFLGLFLTLAVLLGLARLPGAGLVAEASGDSWADWAAGSGEAVFNALEQKDGYYLVGTAAQLAAIANHINNKEGSVSIRLTANIDLESREWTPMGTAARPFAGTFDGARHTISGLSVTEDGSYGGLFGKVSSSNITNLIVKGKVDMSANQGAAGVAGYVETGSFKNVRSEVTVTNKGGYAGGIIGCVSGTGNTVTLEGCSNYGMITGLGVGGIAGSCYYEEMEVRYCYNRGNLWATESAGGLVCCGYGGSISFFGCYNAGVINGGWNRDEGGTMLDLEDYYGAIIGPNEGEMDGECLCLYSGGGNEPALSDPGPVLVSYDCKNYDEMLEYLKSAGPYVMGEEDFPILEWESETVKVTPYDEAEELLESYLTAINGDDYAEEEKAGLKSKIQDILNGLEKDATQTQAETAMGAAKEVLANFWTEKLDALADSCSESDYSEKNYKQIETAIKTAKNNISSATCEDAVTVMPSAYQTAETTISKIPTKDMEEAKETALSEIEDAISEAKAEIEAIQPNDNCTSYPLIQKSFGSLKTEAGEALEDELTIAKKAMGNAVNVAEIQEQRTNTLASIGEVKEAYDEAISEAQTFHEIGTEKEWDAAAAAVNTLFSDLTNRKAHLYNIRLTGDLTLSDNNKQMSYYGGVFLGEGHTITILFSGKGGLIDYLLGAEVKNLTLQVESGKKLSNSTAVGALANRVDVSESDAALSVTLSSCVNYADVTGSSSTVEGGFIGSVKGSSSYSVKLKLEGCENKGNISYTGTSSGYGPGGLIGKIENYCNVTLSGCENSGAVETKGYLAGGLIGIVNSSSYNTELIMEGCQNSGTVTNTKSTSLTTSCGTGGLVGRLLGKGSITSCSNDAVIEGNYIVGGLVGYLDSNGLKISKSWNTKAVEENKTNTGQYLGGIVGYASSPKETTISNVYNCGKVTGKTYLGGLIGYVKVSNISLALENGYSTTVPGGTSSYGSVLGSKSGSSSSLTFNDCYGPDPVYGGTGDLSGISAVDEMGAEDLLAALGDEYQVTDDGQVILKDYADYLAKEMENQKNLAIQELERYVEGNYYPTQWELLEGMREGYETDIFNAETADDVKQIKLAAVANLGGIPAKNIIDNALSAARVSYEAQLTEFVGLDGFQEETRKKLKDSITLSNAIAAAETGFEAVTGEAYSVEYGEEDQNQAFEDILKTAKASIGPVILNCGGWDGETVKQPAKSGSVYLITNGAELAWLAQHPADWSVALANDIDLGGRLWTPIGTSSASFRGTFDGDGHSVYGLYVYENVTATYGYFGLFGYVSSGRIENLNVSGTIALVCDSGASSEYAGGIAGRIGNSVVQNCSSSVSIEVESNQLVKNGYAGGIAGYCGGTIINCGNYGKVGNGGHFEYVGGITGYASSATVVSFCCNRGEVSGQKYAGGIAGWLSRSTVRQSFNGAEASVKGSIAGGIAGRMGNPLLNKDGGSSVTDCYNMGSVTVVHGLTGFYGGGIVGQIEDESSEAPVSTHQVLNTYSAGAVSVDSNGGTVGGIVGDFQCGTLKNNYVADGSCGQILGVNEGIYTKLLGSNTIRSDLKAKGPQLLGASFCGDSEEINGGYPILVWQSADAELQTEIFDAILELETEWLTSDNKTYRYGSQYSVLEELVGDYSAKLAQAKSTEEIEKLAAEAEEKLGAVKTELDLAKEEALATLQKCYDSKNGLCTDEDQEELDALWSEAQEAINAVSNDTKTLVTSKVSDVNGLLTEYLEQMEAIETIDQTALATAKGIAKSQLGTEYAKLLENNPYTDENKAALAEAKENAETEIDACTDADAVTAALEQGIKAMQKIPTDVSVLGLEDLYNKLSGDLKSYAEELVNSGLYADEQKTELNDLYTEYQKKLDDLYTEYQKKLEAENSGGDEETVKTSLQEIYAEALSEMNAVQTKEAADTAALAAAKEAAAAELNDKLSSLKTDYEGKLTENDEARMESLLKEALAAIEAAQTPDQVTEIKESTEASWEQIAAAAADEEVWHGLASENEPATAEDDEDKTWYMISTAAELKWLADRVNENGSETAYYAKLTADIDLGNQVWTPIGTSSNPWQGVFDGDGHTISNLYLIAQTDATGVGLFGYAKSSTIQDLTVSGEIQAAEAEKVGGLLGSGDHVCIMNAVSSVNLVVSSDTNKDTDPTAVGGAVGYLSGSDSNLTNIVYKGTIQVTNVPRGVGGIAGAIVLDDQDGVTIQKCVNEGQVLTTGGKYVGGIAGYLSSGTSTIMKTLYCANHGAVTGAESLGGIIGYAGTGKNSGSATVSWVYNTGSVAGDGVSTISNVGGIIGQAAGSQITLSRAYNKVIVAQGQSGSYIGAVVGYADNGNYSTAIYALEGTAANLFGKEPTSGFSASFATAEQAVSGALTAALNAGASESNFKTVTGKNDTCPVLWFEVTFEDERNAALEELKQSFESLFQEENYYADEWNELNRMLNEKLAAIEKADEDGLDAIDLSMSDMLGVETRQQVLERKIIERTEELTAKYNEYYNKMDDYLTSDWVTIFNAYTQGVIDIQSAASPEEAEAAKDAALETMAQVKTQAELQSDSDALAAQAVIKKINAIGEVSLDSFATILDAENAYNKLTDGQKEQVTNYDDLVAAWDKYEDLVLDTAGDATDEQKAELVDYLIESLGDNITIASGDAIERARTAYKRLTESQKELVENLEILEAAEAAYDTACVQVFNEACAAIGEVTESSGYYITNAWDVYEKLTDSQKEMADVTLLQEKEKEYQTIVRVASMVTKIEAIGNVTTGSESLIRDAQDFYDELSDEEKAYLSSYYPGYKALFDLRVKTYNDMTAAADVENVINSIGAVTVNSGDAIEAARDAYDKLTDDQKVYVQNSGYYSILTAKETQYALKTSAATTANPTGTIITPGLLGSLGLSSPLYSTDTTDTDSPLLASLTDADGSTTSNSLIDSLGDGLDTDGLLVPLTDEEVPLSGSLDADSLADADVATSALDAAAGAAELAAADTSSSGGTWKTVAACTGVVGAVVLAGAAGIFLTAGKRKKSRFSNMT